MEMLCSTCHMDGYVRPSFVGERFQADQKGVKRGIQLGQADPLYIVM